MTIRWTSDSRALALLETEGGPFDGAKYREALRAAIPEWREASFGASLPDGRAAAIALVVRGGAAESVPPATYGGIIASGHLSSAEATSFLRLARRAAGAATLTARGVPINEWHAVAGAKAVSTASVVRIARGEPPEAGFARLARRSIRRAQNAGGAVTRSAAADGFLALYRPAAARWTMRYPDELIQRLGWGGLARFYNVNIAGAVVASLMAMTEGSHWMCWLAAQSPAGRSVAASYLAYQAVLADAQAGGVSAVSLGASAPHSGGKEFKQRLGAVEVPMVSWRVTGPLAHSRRILMNRRWSRVW